MSVLGKNCPTISASSLTFYNGQPTDVPAPGQPTIVELWATWCGPCRMAFPHLSQLAAKFSSSGLRVVGISTEPASPALKTFVEGQGKKMDYTVAADAQGSAAQELMTTAEVTGIPHAFIVDREGIIRYSGHPMDPSFETTLQQVCSEREEQPKKELPRITQSRDKLRQMKVKELKEILTDRGIGFADLHEKDELVDRIIEQCSSVTYYA